jgi:hypothetical protein
MEMLKRIGFDQYIDFEQVSAEWLVYTGKLSPKHTTSLDWGYICGKLPLMDMAPVSGIRAYYISNCSKFYWEFESVDNLFESVA